MDFVLDMKKCLVCQEFGKKKRNKRFDYCLHHTIFFGFRMRSREAPNTRFLHIGKELDDSVRQTFPINGE